MPPCQGIHLFVMIPSNPSLELLILCSANLINLVRSLLSGLKFFSFINLFSIFL
ncbi:hypothetical protein BBUWI9123_E0029 (plasmid) [Borreliella burgdorferi WI91-23]|nr:hypothetical protein BBUWI9123_E0029 [Borreliella burgdorferi WI91-23]